MFPIPDGQVIRDGNTELFSGQTRTAKVSFWTVRADSQTITPSYKRGAVKPGKEYLLERRVNTLEEWECHK